MRAHRQGDRQEVRPLRHPGEQRRPQHPERELGQLTPEGVDAVIDGNLSSAFYCSTAVLPMMRKRKDGVLIHTSSMAGRRLSLLSGAGLLGGQARRGGDEPHDQHGGVRQRHPLLRASARARWRRRSSTSGRCPVDASRTRRHGPVGGCRRPDPLRRLPARSTVCINEVGDHPDLEPRLRRRPAATAT